MNFAAETASARRLQVLRILKATDGRANESILKTALKYRGFEGRMLGDGVRADLSWLEARDLVTTSLYDDTIMVGEITRRGLTLLAREMAPLDGIDYPQVGD